MIQNLINQMLDLVFSWRYLAGFISGLIAQQAFVRAHGLYVRKRYPDLVRPTPGGISYTWAISLLAFMVVGLMMYSTQQNYLAWKCQRDLIMTINTRASLKDQVDDLADERDSLVLKWTHDLVLPPPEYSALSINDPVRQAWTTKRTLEINALFGASIAHQEALEKARPAYPIGTCSTDSRW